MTVKDYAKQNQISIETVRRRIRSGKIEAKLVEDQYIIDHNKTTTPPQQDDNTQYEVEIERLQARVKNLESKIGDQE